MSARLKLAEIRGHLRDLRTPQADHIAGEVLRWIGLPADTLIRGDLRDVILRALEDYSRKEVHRG